MAAIPSVPNMEGLNSQMNNDNTDNELEVQLISDLQSTEKDFGNKDADDDTSVTSLGSSAEFSSSLGLSFSAIGFNSIEPSSPTKRRRSSVFLWEDDRLQGTRLVQKKLDKAAATITRFFRSSHDRHLDQRIKTLHEPRRLEEAAATITRFFRSSHDRHLDQRIKTLSEKLVADEKSKQDELAKINEWKLEAMETFRQELEGELQNLRIERKETMKEMRPLRSELAVLEQETLTLRKDCKLLEMSNKKLKLKNAKLERETTTLRSKVSQLESDNVELKSIQENYQSAAGNSDRGAHGMKKLGNMEKKKREGLVKCIDSIVSLTRSQCKSGSKLVEKVQKLQRRGEKRIKAQLQEFRIN